MTKTEPVKQFFLPVKNNKNSQNLKLKKTGRKKSQKISEKRARKAKIARKKIRK